MKKPDFRAIRSRVESGLTYAKEHGEPLAKQAVEGGRTVLSSKFGKRLATGAIAGGAIAYAIPFMAISTGAVLGAGAMLFMKSLQDKEPPRDE